jgi:hypothetical protein
MMRMFCVAGVLAPALFAAPILVLSLFAAPVLAQEQAKAGKVLRVPRDYNSIQKALDEADPGDTVFVDDGTYRESVVLRDDVVLIGAAAERVILKGDRKKPVVTGAQGAEIRHVTVENGHSGILCANVIMIIENCVVRGNRGTGIHCLISLPVIRNNIIFRNATSGVYCETTRSHRGYVANNMIAENGYSGLMLAGQSEVLVENNVFYFNKQYGIFTAEGARKSRIIYNALYGNRQPASSFTVVDRSNIQQDPGYSAAFDIGGAAFWDASSDVLRGKGKDGKDIGPQKRTLYKPQTAAKPAKPAIITEQKPSAPAAKSVDNVPSQPVKPVDNTPTSSVKPDEAPVEVDAEPAPENKE